VKVVDSWSLWRCSTVQVNCSEGLLNLVTTNDNPLSKKTTNDNEEVINSSTHIRLQTAVKVNGRACRICAVTTNHASASCGLLRIRNRSDQGLQLFFSEKTKVYNLLLFLKNYLQLTTTYSTTEWMKWKDLLPTLSLSAGISTSIF